MSRATWGSTAERTGAGAGPATPGFPDAGIHVELKRKAYDSYRRRQAHALLGLIPQAGVRPLYARAREWARERELHDGRDPMATLLRFCEELLPLPSFHVWLQDTGRHPERHLTELGRGPDAVGAEEGSLPIEARSFTIGDATWYATLSVFQAEGAWRGYLSFHRGPGTRILRTAEIFREDRPARIRIRFRDFDESSLRAFLRSVSP